MNGRTAVLVLTVIMYGFTMMLQLNAADDDDDGDQYGDIGKFFVA